MPTVTLNKEVLEKLIGKKLSLEELKDRISYLGTDLESIERNEIVVEIFPNRPDLLSEQGFARALSSFIGIGTGLKKYKVNKSSYRVKIDTSVKKVRPYTACAVVKNLKFNDEKIREIIQIQEKLHVTYGRNRKKAAIGIYPFEKITTPIYYKALPKGEIKFRPLESDKEMNGVEILSKHPAGKEYGYLLDGLDEYPVFLDANGKVLSMPPIINSHDTGKISEETTEVFIECSGFDFETLKVILNIIVTALADMGGEIYSMELFYEGKREITPDLSASEMKLDLSYVNKILGLDLDEENVKDLLERMGFSYRGRKALIPAYRADILHSIDLVEDIAIAYGYENFKPEIPKVATIAKENEFEPYKRKVQEILVGLGFLETSSFNIIGKELLKKCKISEKFIELKNPLSKEFDILRPSLIPSLLQILSENQHNEYPQKLFEINYVFKDDSEKSSLGVAISHEKAGFTELKQILDALVLSLGLGYSIEPKKVDGFIEGRSGEILLDKKSIGVIGEIHPSVLVGLNLGVPVSLFEIDLGSLYEGNKKL
ncbi:MAG: phenylalanine--tRNA ligase subunit beta [Candidatus Woesearchaeota archaeon]